MTRFLAALLALTIVAGCGDGQPFFDEDDDGGVTDPDPVDPDPTDPDPTDPDATDPLSTGTVRPPLTEEAIARGDIVRAEIPGDGGGLVSSVIYDSSNDTFLVDGLAFDGLNVYARGTPVSQLNGFAVYEADLVTPDSLTGDPIGQAVPYRALYGVSETTLSNGDPRTSFAIVRTGAYTGYGFGGFIYERNGSVTLPVTGQAIYTGDYAGVRVFDGAGGLEYTTGDMFIQIDFDDFDSNDGIYGEISNRQAFDVNGDEIPLGGEGQLILPTVQLTVEQGDNDLLANGEFSGAGVSLDLDGEAYETGSYFAVIAGDATAVGDGGEIVGIIVIESDDPRFDDVSAQETGGFILTRGSGG